MQAMNTGRPKNQSDYFENHNFDTIALARKRHDHGRIHNEHAKVTRIGELLRLKPGCTVLDVGCGTGFASIESDGIRKTGAEMVSVDLSIAEIGKAVEYSRMGKLGPMTFLVADARHLPFKNDAFDAAFCIGLLHHVEDYASGISELMRVAPRVCVIEPNLMNPIQFTWRSTSDASSRYETKAFVPMKLAQEFKGAGFTKVTRLQMNFLPSNTPSLVTEVLSHLEPLLEKIPLVNLLSGSVVILAER